MNAQNGSRPSWWRRRRLINRGLQMRITGTFVSLGCLASLFQVGLLNFSLMRLEGAVEASILRETLPVLLTTNLLVTLAVLVPCMTLIGVLMTFRVAGPAHRIETHLRAIAAGERPGPCKIRDDDELQSLNEALNSALERLGSEDDEQATADEQAA